MTNNSTYIAAIVKITSSKWTLPILHVLADGTKRYYEIGNALPGLTQKMLTNRLHMLEDIGFIKRNAYPTIPPKVEYSLTTLGNSFTDAYTSVIDWAKLNLESVGYDK